MALGDQQRSRHGESRCIAELTAKVAYNASTPIDPFDEDSGWWLAANLRYIVEQVADAGFEERAWSTLADNLGPVT